MSTTELDIELKLAAKEVFSAAEAPSGSSDGQRTLYTGGKRLATVLNGQSTPKIDKPPVAFEITLGSGITTIDLTAVQALVMPSGLSRTLDFTAAKLKAFLFECSVAAVNIAPGAANPYPLFGTGNDLELTPGQLLIGTWRGVETTLPAVSATVKNIDISGGAGRKLYLELYFGT